MKDEGGESAKMKKCTFCKRRLSKRWPWRAHPNCIRKAHVIVSLMTKLFDVLDLPVSITIEKPTLEDVQRELAQ